MYPPYGPLFGKIPPSLLERMDIPLSKIGYYLCHRKDGRAIFEFFEAKGKLGIRPSLVMTDTNIYDDEAPEQAPSDCEGVVPGVISHLMDMSLTDYSPKVSSLFEYIIVDGE